MLSILRALLRSRCAVARPPRLHLERLEERTVPSGSGVVATSKIGIVRPTSSGVAVFALDSNGDGQFDSGDSVFSFGLDTDKFLVGDWNGDGSDKIGVVRPQANGTDIFALDTNGDRLFDTGDQVFSFGLSSDIVLVGDWNGDGRAKIGVVRFNADGTATVSLDTNGDGVFDAGDQVFNFGQTGDKFIVGDWNGDGKSKVGVVRNDGQGGATVIFDMNDNGSNDPTNVVTNHFGYYADTFVVGDWNGDGKSKIGVVRPTASGEAIWALDTNGSGTFDPSDQVFYFGLNTDTFLVGNWKQTTAAATSVPTTTPAPTTPTTTTPTTTTPTTTTPVTSTPTTTVSTSSTPTPANTGLYSTIGGLTVADLQPIIQTALNAWIAAGLNSAEVQDLENAQIQIAPLTNGWMAQTAGEQITIDSTAQGLGWFVDPTPTSNAAYPTDTATGLQATSGTPAAEGVDLVTVIAHEMGHVLGLPAQTTVTNDVMYLSLGVGFRRLPTAQDVALIPEGIKDPTTTSST